MKIEEIDAIDIIVGKRGRKDFGGILSLKESIEQHGLDNPLTVSKREDGKFDLIAGERRLKALLILGFVKMPCIVREDLSSVQRKLFELEENIQRKDLDWDEKIEIYRQIDMIRRKEEGEGTQGSKDESGWTQEKMARKVGVSLTVVSRNIRFAKLLKRRPDIKKKIKGLPLWPAMKRADMILKGEKLSRLEKGGKIEFSGDIRLGNCLDLILDIPDESIDLILTDPPFGIDQIESMRGKDRGSVQSYTSGLTKDDNLLPARVLDIMRRLIPELGRILKPSRHFYMFFSFGLSAHIKRLFLQNDFELGWVPLIWNKGYGTGPPRGYDYVACYEPILFGWKKPKKRYLKKCEKNILTFSPVSSKKKKHPFEKPFDLLSFLINQSTNLGELVLDPFCGSGSTVLAAIKNGRNGIGFELNRDHFLCAQERVGKEKK